MHLNNPLKNVFSQKHDLPFYDQIFDLKNETAGFVSATSHMVESRPTLVRLVQIFLNEGITGVCEDLNTRGSGL